MPTPTSARRARRLIPLVAALVGSAVAAYWVRNLHTYRVPLTEALVPAAAIFACAYSAAREILAALCAETHRCRVSGCNFRVRLTRPDAVESRRWQEAAAAHPDHERYDRA